MGNHAGRENVLRNSALLVALLTFAVTGWSQHHNNAPAPRPSAPAQHSSAPAHNAPAAHPANSAAMRPSGNSAHPSGNTGARTGANMGHTNSASTMNRGTGRSTTAGTANHGSVNHGTASHGTTNTAASHNSNMSGRTNSAGAHNTGMTNRAGMNGNMGHTSAMARNASAHTPPGRQVSLRGGGSASLRPNGQIRSVNRNGMHIEHNLHGDRTIVSEHNGARYVTNGRHGGYVQRSYVTRGGRSYYSRTYYYHGEYRSVVYRGYYYGGYHYYGYYHPYWYHPAFYGWAYNPWPAPVYWGWGWGGAPWYGYYGPYFAPYPVYPTAAFWVTDYLIAANLQAAYAAQAEAAAEAGAASNYGDADQAVDRNLIASTAGGAAPDTTQVTLSPEIKRAIAEEVKAQIAAAQAEAGSKGSSVGGQPAAASNEIPPALDSAHRIFVVTSDIAVVADGQECSLSQGDVITRLTDTPDQDHNVNVSVSASKKGDCATGKTVAVSVDDLQEMHNHFAEQIDDGLKTLAAKQGTGGLPKAPDTTTTASDVPPPAPDKTAGKALETQEAEADKTESDVKQEATSSESAGGEQ
jgi:hypothetical protein